jgi:hypothetical protein
MRTQEAWDQDAVESSHERLAGVSEDEPRREQLVEKPADVHPVIGEHLALDAPGLIAQLPLPVG